MKDRTRPLVEAATRGDANALDELVNSCLPRLHAYVRLNMGAELRAREDSLDLVQSVCREVLHEVRSGFEYRGERAFLGYVFHAALNKMRMRHRALHSQRRDIRRELSGLDDLAAQYATVSTPGDLAAGRESVERLEDAFERLPAHYREVITRSRLLGMSVAEIAAATNRTENAVRGLLGRGLRELARLLPRD